MKVLFLLKDLDQLSGFAIQIADTVSLEDFTGDSLSPGLALK